MKPIIKIENVSKQYRLGTIGTGTLSHDLNRWWSKMRGKGDPILKIGEINDRANKGNSEYVWALRNINFEVMPGEVVGIIGKNGAGKSTLLKILSKVTGPTTGSIQYDGRIGSLLEVGTGFHPELTGRENIFLNGAILGMSKSEIRSKLDEIVDFSGCERYIDTPVKRYSSGMKVRLGFAVAAHLEPEILVVDEVLAVGDAEFQKKAIGKMQDVSRNDGRTVLFVSHSMGAIQSLCSRSVILDAGGVKFDGDVKEGIEIYLNDGNKGLNGSDLSTYTDRKGHLKGKLIDLSVGYEYQNKVVLDSKKIPIGSNLIIRSKIDNISAEVRKFDFSIIITDRYGVRVTCVSNEFTKKELILEKGVNEFEYKVFNLSLLPDIYYFRIWMKDQYGVMDVIDDVMEIEVVESNILGSTALPNSKLHGYVLFQQEQNKIS
ncbi:ABC transporter ATP-binding protein [Carboxylicivirga linearis]|uniref:ATP-binding cassette domain-containing protein n=1 Tax=Carboxylicivirga linearis TaxID=1628157 RepID=A0ABS5JX92_9BACT|nr:ABC transporter ATP-binding protein [Carboxylicivirga linearis]MBS2099084.1 ATP-binding cassette domain-containing protein [Carboxylicivirga linearis]